MHRFILIFFILIISLSACQKDNTYQEKVTNPEYLHRSMSTLTDVIVHDIFSPPVASRIYAYPSIAAYEIMSIQNEEYNSLAGQLHDLEKIPIPQDARKVCFPLASVHAFLSVGKALIFSEKMIEEYQESLYKEMKDLGIPSKVFKNSISYGQSVAAHILGWADTDNYKQTRTFPKHSFTDEPDAWKPTPPDYMTGIEPHWNKIRTFVLDSANQFIPPPPTEFSLDKESTFFKELMQVYEAVKNGSSENHDIARFWDCNPYVSHHQGHAMFATKKITPGGHWIGITEIACKKDNANFYRSTEAYALTSITLVDAFISCWDEKYRSLLIRPETLINEHIDENWLPILQTPPFPEYTSGHSVISSAAAIALTSLFGDSFEFIDSVEVKYGLPARKFNSFKEASEEAAVSRLYGGIHYMPAINHGVDQGRKVGKLIVEKLLMENG
jgi:hypothetical protein